MTVDQDNGERNEQKDLNEKKKTSVYRTPLFTKLYATNLRVSPTDVDFRIEFFNEKIETEDELIFYSDGVAMLTPEAAKKLLMELNKSIEKYEIENGEIPIREERKNCEFTEE